MSGAMSVGSNVMHCMGHRGVIVAMPGPLQVFVRFVNTIDLVFISDLTPEGGK